MLGLKRRTVELVPYQVQWKYIADDTIRLLKTILGETAIDIRHVGSTAIPRIHAKPIIDLAVGVHNLPDILPYADALEQHGIILRGEDVAEQLLFVMGDFEQDTRTHHIHIVSWNSTAWNHYIDFCDYLNAFPLKAALYDQHKLELAEKFPKDRANYTKGKQKLIDSLLAEAADWKHSLEMP